MPESRAFEGMFSCTHEDYPCGCGPELLTPEQAEEREREEEYFFTHVCDINSDHPTVLDDAEADQTACGPDLHDMEFEDRISGDDGW